MIFIKSIKNKNETITSNILIKVVLFCLEEFSALRMRKRIFYLGVYFRGPNTFLTKLLQIIKYYHTLSVNYLY